MLWVDVRLVLFEFWVGCILILTICGCILGLLVCVIAWCCWFVYGIGICFAFLLVFVIWWLCFRVLCLTLILCLGFGLVDLGFPLVTSLGCILWCYVWYDLSLSLVSLEFVVVLRGFSWMIIVGVVLLICFAVFKLWFVWLYICCCLCYLSCFAFGLYLFCCFCGGLLLLYLCCFSLRLGLMVVWWVVWFVCLLFWFCDL